MPVDTLNIDADLTDRIEFCDPHGGHETIQKTSARGSIVVVARDFIDRFWVLEAFASRCTTDQLVERLFEMNDRWSPWQCRVESATQQGLFVDMIRREGILRRKKINVVPHPVSTRVNKEARIREILHLPWAEGRIIIRDDMLELKSELRAFPVGETCDLVDALASCISAFPASTTSQMKQEERESYAEFLRESNLPEHYIRNQLSDYDEDRNSQPLGLKPSPLLPRER